MSELKATGALEDQPDQALTFSFFKGGEDVVALKEDADSFDWDQAASKVREQLSDAMNARNVAFLLGSGCSSYYCDDNQVGIPTMAPMAKAFLAEVGTDEENIFITQAERGKLMNSLGLDIGAEEYAENLERLLEVLFSLQFVLNHSSSDEVKPLSEAVEKIIHKVTRHVLNSCTEGKFSDGDMSVGNLYQDFYQKLIFRDRALPRPWIFTTNYDLFNETAMDRLGIPYCNGFLGAIERRFNPATFRYSLAEQLDITSKKWSAVDNFVYLCKLHGSVNWVEKGSTLFPIRELQKTPSDAVERVLIYPTPTKQNASFGSPYSDLFREFQGRIVRDQSVLFTLGYSFCDEHINNIIFQALTIPNFRLIAFLPPDIVGIPKQLRDLGDPRIWIIGGDGQVEGRKAHYFDTFIEKFMPEPPGNKINTAVARVLETMINSPIKSGEGEGSNAL